MRLLLQRHLPAEFVFYADQLQILVKWDNGGSSSLRVGRDQFRIIDPEQENNRR